MAKPSSTDLYELVRSMSKGEKKHFKLFISKEADSLNSNIVKLFDIMNTSTEYNEAKIISSGRVKGNFPTIKHNLSELVMQSLLVYHANDSTDIRIKNLLVFAQVLRYKRLFKQCYTILDKAEKLAEKTENYMAWLEISDTYNNIAADEQNLKVLEKRSKTLPAEENTIRRWQNLREYKQLTNQMRISHLRNAFASHADMQQENENVMKHELLTSDTRALGIREKIFFNNIKGTFYFTSGNFERAHHYSRENVNLFDKNPFLIEDETVEYFQRLISLLIIQGRHDIKSQLVTVGKLRGLLEDPSLAHKLREYEGMIWFYTYSAEFSACFYSKEYIKAKEYSEKLFSAIEKYDLNLSPRLLQIVYYNFSCMHFCLHNYKETNQWISKVLSIGFNERVDTEYHSRIVNIICSYELKDVDYVISSLQKLYRFSNRFKQYPIFTAGFTKIMLSLCKSTSKKEQVGLLEEMKVLVKNTAELSGEQLLLKSVYVDVWLDHKIHRYRS